MSEESTLTRQFFDALPRKHVAAGCIFLDEQGRVLLVKPTYKEPWEIPGGVVEEGESPLEACCREIAEELGVDWRPTAFLGVDYRPAVDGVRGDALRFVFLGGITGEAMHSVRLATAELSEWRFVAVDDLDRYLIPPMTTRLRSLLAGAKYVEEGEEVLPPRAR